MKEIILNADNFDTEVLNAEGKVLVDFFATWCGPCKMLAPVIEEFAAEQGDVKVCKLDVDGASSIAIKYGVNVIPTLILFENGGVIKKEAGFMDKAELKDFIK